MSNEPLTLEQVQSSAERIEEAFGVEAGIAHFQADRRTYEIRVCLDGCKITFEHNLKAIDDKEYIAYFDFDDDLPIRHVPSISSETWGQLFAKMDGTFMGTAQKYRDAYETLTAISEVCHE